MSTLAGIYYFNDQPVPDESVSRVSRAAPHGCAAPTTYLRGGLIMAHSAFHFDALSRMEIQPFITEGQKVITFTGRIDNRQELSISLSPPKGVNAITDVELIAAAYDKWQTNSFSRLIGDWGIVVWVPEKREIHLASDFIGTRPLYYRPTELFVAWSTDLQTLMEISPGSELDRHYVAAFLTRHPSYDRTIYEEIRQVVPGHYVICSSRGASLVRYDPTVLGSRIEYGRSQEYEESLLHLFAEAVKSRLRSDGNVCCDLSGGLDSSSVTCVAHTLVGSGSVSPRGLFTYSEVDEAMDDKAYFPVVVEHCRATPLVAPMKPIWSLSEPSTHFPRINVPKDRHKASLLRQSGVVVNITGHPGDVVMANDIDDTGQLADYLVEFRLAELGRQAYRWSRALRIPIWEILRRASLPFLPREQSRAAWIANANSEAHPYRNLARETCVCERFIEAWIPRCPTVEVFRGDGATRLRPSQRRFLQWIYDLQVSGGIVPPPDMNPIYTTYPFADRRLVQFIAGIPRAQLCQPGRPRDLMRRALEGAVPSAVLSRRSKAVAGNRRDSNIKEVAPALLGTSREFFTADLGCVDGTAFRAGLEGMIAGKPVDWIELSRVLTLELWLRNRDISKAGSREQQQCIEVRPHYA